MVIKAAKASSPVGVISLAGRMNIFVLSGGPRNSKVKEIGTFPVAYAQSMDPPEEIDFVEILS